MAWPASYVAIDSNSHRPRLPRLSFARKPIVSPPALATTSEDAAHQNYDVSPDGKFVVIQTAAGGAEAVLVHNWGRELREKLGGSRRP